MSPCPGLCPVAKVFFGPKRDLTGGHRGRWSREAGVRLAGSHTRRRVFSTPPLGCWSISPKPLEADSDPGPPKLNIHLSGRSACVLHLVQGADRRTSSGGLRPPLPAPQTRLEPRGLCRGPRSGGCRPQGRASLASLSPGPLSPSDPSPSKIEPQLGARSPSARRLPSPV